MLSDNNIKKIFCSGTFCFDYKQEDNLSKAKMDYRSRLLGNPLRLFHLSEEQYISERVRYIGPFYFETENMEGVTIVGIERKMIEDSTDVLFILDNATCPGTIAELMVATHLQKTIHIFYVRHNDTEETESLLHTPCWYPILLCQQLNPQRTLLFECGNRYEAEDKMIHYIQNQL